MNVPTDVEDTRATSAATFQERAPDPVAQGANLTEEQLRDTPLNQVQPDGSIKATGPTPRELETQTGARPAQASHPTGTQAEAPAGENDSSSMTDADRLGAPRAGEPVHSSSGGQLASAEADDLGGDLTENVGSQVAKKGLGSALKSAVSGVGSEGLEAGAMTALDAVPVIGELAAVGMGLYSLFHGLSDKPPDAEDEKAKAQTGAEGAAIDPSALLGKA